MNSQQAGCTRRLTAALNPQRQIEKFLKSVKIKIETKFMR